MDADDSPETLPHPQLARAGQNGYVTRPELDALRELHTRRIDDLSQRLDGLIMQFTGRMDGLFSELHDMHTEFTSYRAEQHTERQKRSRWRIEQVVGLLALAVALGVLVVTLVK